jgi:hypothetical protein
VGGRLDSILAAGSIAGAAAWSLPAAAAPTTALTNPLAPPSDCAECHEFINPSELASEPPVSPMLVWRGTMMANAARDPVFWAAVAVAAQDAAADDTGVLTDATQLCVRCHSPRAALEGNAAATSIDELTPQQREGIECEVCHRMMEDPGTPAGNAGWMLDDTLVGDTVPRRGPWTYDANAPEEERPGHPFIADPYTGSSRLCGTCHDVTTPRERYDADGAPMGVPFNEQRTYSEWANSALAAGGEDHRDCVDCHMPAIEDAAGCYPFYETGDPALLHATGARRHDLVGANRFMLERLRDLYGESEVPAEHFDATIELSSMAASAALVEMEPPATIDVREGIDALTVRVTNQTGHKLPSGYSEGRLMWLEVTATIGDAVVFSSGRWLDGEIEQDDQLHTYEAIARDHVDDTRDHLLLNDQWLVDERIPPRGLQPDVETDPVGDRYPLEADGTWRHYDEVVYAFAGRDDIEDVSPGSSDDAIVLRARLLYLVNTPEYIEFLRDENLLNDAGQTVAAIFEDAGGATPVVFGQQMFVLPVTGLVGQPAAEDDTGPAAQDSGAATSSGSDDSGGMEAQSGDDGGCACRTAPGHDRSPPPVWLWVVLAPALRRRARRPRDRSRAGDDRSIAPDLPGRRLRVTVARVATDA